MLQDTVDITFLKQQNHRTGDVLGVAGGVEWLQRARGAIRGDGARLSPDRTTPHPTSRGGLHALSRGRPDGHTVLHSFRCGHRGNGVKRTRDPPTQPLRLPVNP